MLQDLFFLWAVGGSTEEVRLQDSVSQTNSEFHTAAEMTSDSVIHPEWMLQTKWSGDKQLQLLERLKLCSSWRLLLDGFLDTSRLCSCTAHHCH